MGMARRERWAARQETVLTTREKGKNKAGALTTRLWGRKMSAELRKIRDENKVRPGAGLLRQGPTTKTN